MKQIVAYLFILCGLFQPKESISQTTLNPGDMAFLGFNTAGTFDAISFITFVDLQTNTVFYFSDCPYKSGAFCTGGLEHCIQFTASSYIVAGTVITYDDSQNYPTAPTPTLSSTYASCGSIAAAFSATGTAGTNPGLNSKGDNGFIFQGSYAAPTFVCAIKNGSNWKAFGTASCTSTDDAELPATLTNGTTALWTGNGSCKGVYYNCASVPSTTTSASSPTFNNTANWTCDANGVTLPTILSPCSFSFLISPCILPIELTAFTAKQMPQSIQLNWATASETNSGFFTVEKSSDGILFKEVTQVKGAGNSDVTKYYSVSDENPFDGVTYYRLKQTDFNGRYTYSNIVELDYSLQSNIKVYPNPNNGTFSIEAKSNARCIVYNATGSEVLNQSITGKTTIDAGNLNEGVYNLSIISNEGITNKRLVIVK